MMIAGGGVLCIVRYDNFLDAMYPVLYRRRPPPVRPPLDNDTDTVCVRGGRERWLPKRGGSFSAS